MLRPAAVWIGKLIEAMAPNPNSSPIRRGIDGLVRAQRNRAETAVQDDWKQPHGDVLRIEGDPRRQLTLV